MHTTHVYEQKLFAGQEPKQKYIYLPYDSRVFINQ